MAIEIIDGQFRKEEEGNFFPEVVREITEHGQVFWFKSSPKEDVTSSPSFAKASEGQA